MYGMVPLDQHRWLSERMPLEEWFDRYQYAVTANIGESAIRSLSVAELALPSRAIDALRLRYGHHQGLPELREAVAAGYPGLTADDIVITAGASEAIVLVAMVLLGHGSRVVVEHPTYPTLYRVPRALRATVELFPLMASEQWRPDWSELRRLMAPGADLVAITHPNNPTGSMISASELREALAIAADSGSRLVSDETYRLLILGPPLPPAACLDPRAISISTMSKTFGLPGLRVGWVATQDREVIRRLVACREHITITNNAFGEFAALEVLRAPEPFLDQARQRLAGNYDIVAAAVNTTPRLSWVPPAAGVVALPWIEGAEASGCRALYQTLAERYGTFVVPGSGFELPDTYFRIGFGGEPDELRTGLGRLAAALTGETL
jgi:aspartate/methionine/tyrosine aminotransferase